ncbi:MAG: hypothetical protein ACR2HN_03335, partial [Tepidiformaceae bacterium]
MSTYRERAAREIRSERPAQSVGPIMRTLVRESAIMLARSPGDAPARAAAARGHAIAHLVELHAQV